MFKITFTSSKRTGKTHFYAMFRKIKTKKVSLLDTSQIDYLYNEGYNQAKKFLKETNIKL